MSSSPGYQPRPGAEALRPPDQGSSVRRNGDGWPHDPTLPAADTTMDFARHGDRVTLTCQGRTFHFSASSARAIGGMLVNVADDIDREAAGLRAPM